ncbi:hypothetical protein TNCV_2129931 [Trichonephila clavipes]|nr:hypothetical protein TNCV_2129931 [Trichonephila clavipes]
MNADSVSQLMTSAYECGEDQAPGHIPYLKLRSDGRPEFPNLELAPETAWNLFTSPRTGCGEIPFGGGSSESVQELAARINKLRTQIFQSSNSVLTTAARNANDQLLQSRFISGLRNYVRRFVLVRYPNTLEESINAVLIEEQNLKLNEIASNERHGLSSLLTESPVISALTDKMQELNLRVERLQEAKGHRQVECRKRIADQRPWNSPHFRRSVRDETPVSRSPHIQPVNHRRVRFEDSTSRRFPSVSQRNFRDMGKAGGFRQNRRNEDLNFCGQSQY